MSERGRERERVEMMRRLFVVVLMLLMLTPIADSKKKKHGAQLRLESKTRTVTETTIAGNVKIKTVRNITQCTDRFTYLTFELQGDDFTPGMMNAYANAIVKMRANFAKAKADLDWAVAQLDADANADLPADLIFDVVYGFGIENDRAYVVRFLSKSHTHTHTHTQNITD